MIQPKYSYTMICERSKFDQYVAMKELIIFTEGKEAYNTKLLSCFPYISQEEALEYIELWTKDK